MENVLFKISFPAEFHAQTAVEAAMTLRGLLEAKGKTAADIRKITIRTHEACLRIIDKKGPLSNPADRDHCVQYMIAIPLIFGRLTAADYEDQVANDRRIDALREKVECVEEPQFTKDYHDPEKRSIANSLRLELAEMYGDLADHDAAQDVLNQVEQLRRRHAPGYEVLSADLVRQVREQVLPLRQP